MRKPDDNGAPDPNCTARIIDFLYTNNPRLRHSCAVRDALDEANARDAEKEIRNHLLRYGPPRSKSFTVFTDGSEYAYPLERDRYLDATDKWLSHCDDEVPPPPVPYRNGATELDMSHVRRIHEWIAMHGSYKRTRKKKQSETIAAIRRGEK